MNGEVHIKKIASSEKIYDIFKDTVIRFKKSSSKEDVKNFVKEFATKIADKYNMVPENLYIDSDNKKIILEGKNIVDEKTASDTADKEKEEEKDKDKNTTEKKDEKDTKTTSESEEITITQPDNDTNTSTASIEKDAAYKAAQELFSKMASQFDVVLLVNTDSLKPVHGLPKNVTLAQKEIENSVDRRSVSVTDKEKFQDISLSEQSPGGNQAEVKPGTKEMGKPNKAITLAETPPPGTSAADYHMPSGVAKPKTGSVDIENVVGQAAGEKFALELHKYNFISKNEITKTAGHISKLSSVDYTKLSEDLNNADNRTTFFSIDSGFVSLETVFDD